MDELRARKLLEQVKAVYDSQRTTGLQRWVKEYHGQNGDKEYLEKITEIIIDTNKSSPHLRIMGIDTLFIEELLFYTGFNTSLGREMADIRKKADISDRIKD